MRNAGDAEQIEVGWWPGDARYGRAAFFAYAYPPPPGFDRATLSRRPPTGTRRWASTSWTGTTSAPPRTRTPTAVEFARSAFRHACVVCGWDPGLAASAEGTPPPVR